MSHLPASKQEARRTARKPVVTSPRQQTKPVKRLTQRDMDSSCHRLSRVPQKFTANKAIQNEKQEPYAVNYFKNNPDARDNSPPDKKLEAYEEKLKGDLEVSERFTTLCQQKALRYIVFGENSVEALESHAAIGKFYNANNRPASALRHLNKATQLEETNEIDQPLSIEIAVETAEAHLALRSEKKSETAKHVNQAGAAISRYTETEIADPRMRYRRDIAKARISASKKEFQAAIQQYETAWVSLDEANSGEVKEETGVLYHELADCYDAEDKRKQAAENYKKAYDIYRDFGNDEAADAIQPKLPQPGEEFEEEETFNERSLDQEEEEHSEAPSEKKDETEKEESEPEPTKATESEDEKLPDVLGSLMNKQSEEERENEKSEAEEQNHESEHEEEEKKISEDNWEKEQESNNDKENYDDTQGFEDEDDNEKPKLSDTGGFDDEFEDTQKSTKEESEGLNDDDFEDEF